jgi:hypothetical protein
LRLEIHPDPALGEGSHFMTHFPSHVWYCDADRLRWAPWRHTREDSVTFHQHHLEINVPIEPGQTLLIASNVPLSYASLDRKASEERRDNARRIAGAKIRGRDISILRLGAPG